MSHLSDEDRKALDERIAADRWGYYLHFDPTGNPAVDRILSAVGLAAKAFHGTENWAEAMDVPYGPVRKGESHEDFIQRAANDAAALIAEAERRGAERALRSAASEMPDGGRWSHLRRYGWQQWLRDRADRVRDGEGA